MKNVFETKQVRKAAVASIVAIPLIVLNIWVAVQVDAYTDTQPGLRTDSQIMGISVLSTEIMMICAVVVVAASMWVASKVAAWIKRGK